MNSGTARKNGFINYYELMQINPNAEPETIRRVYKLLAVRLHPDNPHTGDADRFLLLSQAYETLSDPERRQAYDAGFSVREVEPLPEFELKDFAVGVDGERNRRIGLLCLLYNSRRGNQDTPGLSILDLENLMGFPREHLAFTAWYLRQKNYIITGDSSDLMITAEGVDYVESNLPDNGVVRRLLTAGGIENAGVCAEEVVAPHRSPRINEDAIHSDRSRLQ